MWGRQPSASSETCRLSGYRVGGKGGPCPALLHICTVEMHIMHIYEDLISTLGKKWKTVIWRFMPCLEWVWAGRWELAVPTICLRFLRTPHVIPMSKDTRHISHISIKQLWEYNQETDGAVTCKERNWVGGQESEETSQMHWVTFFVSLWTMWLVKPF